MHPDNFLPLVDWQQLGVFYLVTRNFYYHFLSINTFTWQ